MRPVRKIVILWVQLLLWSLICAFKLNASLWKDFEKATAAMREMPLTPFVLFFGLLMAGVARYLQVSGKDAASFFGSGGLESGFAQPVRVGWIWLILAMSATAIGLSIAGSGQRYYFAQDDNFAQFLPGVVYGCREAFAGRFANWNPYQMLGMPLADLGTYALTYPVTYLSYAFAKGILGDEMRVLDVFCWFHLVLGAGAAFLVGRQMRLWGPLAAGVAVCFSLSGYSLIAGRSWYYMTPTMLWFPLLLLLALRFEPVQLRMGWTVAAGVTIGIYYHSGNAQMWFYGLSILLLCLLLRKVKEQWDWRGLMPALPGVLIGIGLSLPLMIPQWNVTQGLARDSFGEGIERGLFSLLLPNPFVNSLMPNKMGLGLDGPGGQFYYAGGLFTLAWLGGIAAICVGNGGMKAFRANPLLTLSVIAFLSALGKNGGLWVLQTKLPLLKGFSQPLKFLPFVHLFTLVIGALFVQSICNRYGNRRVAGACVFGLISVLMFHHASRSTEAFYLYGDRPDYKVSMEMLEGIGKQRLFPVAPQRGGGTEFVSNFLFNSPTLAQVQSIDGYEPLWRSKRPYSEMQNSFVDDFLGTLRRYGVTRILIHDSVFHPVVAKYVEGDDFERLPDEWVAKLSRFTNGKQPLVAGKKASLFPLDGSEPLARRESDGASLPLTIEDGAVVVKGGGPGEQIMVNYLWRPGVSAYAGKERVETKPDQYSRILLTLPGSGEVRIGYEVDWLGSSLKGCLLVLAGLLLAWLQYRQVMVTHSAATSS